MCGIAGIFELSQRGKTAAEELDAMVATLTHRGPDAAGVRIFRGGGFGHTRLAILDLRPEGNQPFAIDDGDLLLTYNGEIFNYIELRAELEALGHRFETSCDTEVVIRAYREWGGDAVRRFNGMWALAIYDARCDELFLSRDRFGIKPFYWAEFAGRLLFASEVKALLAVERGLAEPDYDSLSRMLRAQVAAQCTDSFFAGVKRLKPAHNLVCTRRGFRIDRYWGYPEDDLVDVSLEEAAAHVRDLLEEALRLRMRSDVPVANTLSGGVDSSGLVCLLRRFYECPHKTFSASYPGEPFDEAPQAAELSNELGMTPIPVPAQTTDFLETLDRCVYYLDSPSHTPAVLPLWHIMKGLRQGAVVAIEGQGADELFGGYTVQAVPYALWDRIKHLAWGEALAESRRFGGPRDQLLWSARRIAPWSHRVFRRLRGDEAVYAGPLRGLDDRVPSDGEPPRYRDSVNGQLHHQHTGSLRSLLHYGDAMSMAHSVESRLPYMDFRLVEYVFRLPGALKLQGGHGKAVLREALRGVVPNRILDNRNKIGFVTPIERWFRERPEEVVYPILRDDRCRKRGIFDSEELERALERHSTGRVDLSRQIFRWLTTEIWFQHFIDG